MKTKARKRTHGFSLVELMVVITVIGILATFVVLNVGDLPDRAKITAVQNDFSTLKQAVSMFKTVHGRYPDGFDELIDGPEDPTTGEPTTYIEDTPFDPWTNEEYVWEIDDRNKPFFISYGADMAEGGEGINTDIISNERKNKN